MTDRKPIDPAHLVPGAKVMIEGTVTAINSHKAVTLAIQHSVGVEFKFWLPSNSPAIISVTPPPVDWSKVKRAQYASHTVSVVTVHDDAAWIKFSDGGQAIRPLVALTPLPDEPSAGEAITDEIVKRRFGRNHDKPCRDHGTLTCARWECQAANECQSKAQSDARPAWQRAKVGDVVRHREWRECKVLLVSEDIENSRLFISANGYGTWAYNSDILEIIKVADEKR